MEENNKQDVTQKEGQTQDTAKTYTQEEVDKLLQSEADRRVTEALKTAEKKSQEKLREAQKLAAMNEQQKYEYELDQREKAIVEKEKALALAENKNAASKILAESGLSLALVDFVVAEDADTMNKNIKTLTKAFKSSVEAEVSKRIGGKAPAKTEAKEITKEMFQKMSITQMLELKQTNPELYASLTGNV